MVTPLSDLLAAAVDDLPVPGAAVGVLHDGQVQTAFTGLTSVENPLPVDERTLFQIGSVSKTFAVTAVMRLVGDGRVSLDDPVRRHVSELALADEQVARDVTVRNLLNHTSGWDGTRTSGGSDPDASLTDFVAGMAELEQLTPLGRRAEYNNAGIALAGRLVEKVTGLPYDAAIRSLILDPLGLSDTRFTGDDLMTERCTVGHVDGTTADDGGYEVARPWRWPRAAYPEGGLVASVANVLAWARFHLGDSEADVLRADERIAMQTPTVRLVGNAMGDAVGLGWFLRDVGGVGTLGHSGATNGQYAELRLVPDRDCAVVVLANGPNGPALTLELVDRVLADRLGLRNEPPPARPYDPATDGDVAGRYENNLSRIEATVHDGAVSLEFALQPSAAAEMPGQPERFDPGAIEFLADQPGVYRILDGAFAGLTGSFTRDASGQAWEVDFGGRWHRRPGHRPVD